MHQEHSRAPFRVLASRSIVVVSVVVHLASLLFVLRDQDSVAFCVSLGDGLGVQKNASKESLPVRVPMVNTISLLMNTIKVMIIYFDIVFFK